MVRTQMKWSLNKDFGQRNQTSTRGGGLRKVFNGSNTGTSTLFFRLNHVRLQAQNQVTMSNTFLQATRVLISRISIGWLVDPQNNYIRINSVIMKFSIHRSLRIRLTWLRKEFILEVQRLQINETLVDTASDLWDFSMI